MHKKIIFILVFILISFVTYNIFMQIILTKTILHGDTKYNEFPNSIDHIKDNLKNTKYFELDFQITSDGRLICYHGDENLSEVKFNSLLIQNLIFQKNCYDTELKKFLEKHPGIYIITDFKKNNIEGLKVLKKYFKNELTQFIPQIYFFEEYNFVKKLGFKNIIFSTYKIPNDNNQKIFTNLNKMELFAITVDPARLRKKFYQDKIKNYNRNFIYVHTVNSWIRLLQYKLFYGADGIYTDKLFFINIPKFLFSNK